MNITFLVMKHKKCVPIILLKKADTFSEISNKILEYLGKMNTFLKTGFPQTS